MNPNTGELFRGDAEFLKKIEDRDKVKLIPLTEGQATFVEAMGPIQRKAIAKQERKRLARLEQVRKRQLVSSS